MKILKIIKKLLLAVFGGLFGFFAATQIIYWLNLDNKLIFAVVTPIVKKITEKRKRDKKF